MVTKRPKPRMMKQTINPILLIPNHQVFVSAGIVTSPTVIYLSVLAVGRPGTVGRHATWKIGGGISYGAGEEGRKGSRRKGRREN